MHAIYLSKYVTDEYVKGSAESSLLQQFFKKNICFIDKKRCIIFCIEIELLFFLAFKKKYPLHSFLAFLVLFPNSDFCLEASFGLISIGSML